MISVMTSNTICQAGSAKPTQQEKQFEVVLKHVHFYLLNKSQDQATSMETWLPML